MISDELTQIGNLAREVALREGVLSDLLAVYLFGSRGRGTARSDSDMDIGVLFREPSYVKDPLRFFQAGQKIGAEIGRFLGKATDILILNGASIELAYEIISQGLCCYAPDQDSRWEREAVLRGMYFDFEPFLKELRRNYVDRSEKV